MSSLSTFSPNGLLGSISSTTESSEDFSGNFTSNGLLGDVSTPQNAPFEEMSRHLSSDSSGFVSTGLLNEEIHTGDFTQLGQSQDDTLPDISEILRYNSTSANIPIPDIGVSAAASILTALRASSYEGKPVFFRRKPQRAARRALERQNERMSNLLDIPIHRLMDTLTLEAASLSLSDAVATSSSATLNDDPEDTLWVDRYRPKRFVDLLGDERVHRDTLAWVKEWDYCVFGKRRPKGKAVKRSWEQATEDVNEGEWQKDEYKRPRERLLLLSGPPGLGKTTLAHVVAKQAGYAVFEVNASDARSGQIVDDRIRPVLESGSKVGSDKPSLVVIDEIDGATGAGDNAAGFIQKLVELTQDRPKKKSRNKRDAGAPNSQRPLLRPIICICNDLYASSLAKLRPHARIIRFNRPADAAVVRRLRQICEDEALRVDTRALSTLVGIAKGDLRGCLNTLQFIRSKQQAVTEEVVRQATYGMKEADTSFNNVLNGLFAPITRKRAKELGLNEVEESQYVGRLSREIEASGSMDKVAIGCFEHYTNLRNHDAAFEHHQKGSEWLVAFDMFSGAMRGDREYALMPYLAYTLVPFFPLFQERGGPKPERPKADWENYMVTRTNEEIYKSLSRCLRAASSGCRGDYRHLSGSHILQMEFAPLINRIISPPLRPVNSQVIKPEEKALLDRLVDIMVSLEMRFLQEKGEDGQLVYRLEPPVDVFVTYDGKRAADIAVSRYATRHLVAAEIDAKLIVRHAEAIERHNTTKSAFFGMNEHLEEEDPLGAEHEDGQLLRASAVDSEERAPKKARKAIVDIADKPPTDFFGRPITASVPQRSKKGSVSKKMEKKDKVSFRFNEGNSAAVRKAIKVSAFI